MINISEFIYKKSRVLEKESFQSAEKALNQVTHDFFRKGRLSSDAFIEEFLKIYAGKIEELLDILYSQTCDYISRSDSCFREQEKELVRENGEHTTI